RFSLSFVRAVFTSPDAQNVLFSPVSIVSAFSSLMLGARKETESELFKGFKFNDTFANPTEVHESFGKFHDYLSSLSNVNYSLHTANSILLQKDLKISDNFKQAVIKYYHSLIEQVDFEKDGRKIMSEVNEWVAKQTRNTIKEILEQELDANTKMIILNAVYFKGKWKNRFDKKFTIARVFYNNGSKQKKIDFMQIEAKYHLFRNKEYFLVRLDYVGDLSFFLLLPIKRNGLFEVLKNLEMSKLCDNIESMKERKIDLKLPKFKLESSYMLKPILQKLGISDAFSSKADFSGISDERLFVSEAIHKAFIKVDEDGTEASAATAITSRALSLPQQVDVDHPFSFFIMHNPTSIIFFAGIVNEL
ncbi:uncharacterized protein B4U79_05814, partial [Dinothrombium tinctorium]